MPQSTNLNTPPYFEDFNSDDNFHKVLFRPGFPLQARELTTLQSILQDQIEKFGSSIYKDGAMVIPGQVGYDLKYNALLIEDEYFGIQSNALVSNKNTDGTPVIVGKTIRGNTSGVKAKIVNVLSSDQSERGKSTLYLKYINAGNSNADGIQYTTFQDDEILLTEETFSLGTTVIQENTDFAKCVTSQATSIGSSAKITSGIYFIKGNFVTVPEQEIVLDQFGVTPSYRVGLQVLEEIITPEINDTLNDPSQGYSNYSAPGAHRLKFRTILTKKALDDNTVINFIELLKLEEGECQEIVSTSKAQIAATLEDTLARRTFDESGDYEVTPYEFSTQECLDDGDNNGVFQINEKTDDDVLASENLFEIVASPGKSYVRGYEIETISNTYVDIEKPRTTEEQNNRTISTDGRGVRFNLEPASKITQTHLSSVLGDDNRTVYLKEDASTVIGYASLINYVQNGADNYASLANIVITTAGKKIKDVDILGVGAATGNDYTLTTQANARKITGQFSPSFFEVYGDNDIKAITDLKVQDVLTHYTGTTTNNDITISGEYYSTSDGDYTIRLDNEDAQTLALSSISVTSGNLTATITGRSGSGNVAFTLIGPQKISEPNVTLSSLHKMRILKLENIAGSKYDVDAEILRLGLTRVCKVHAIYNADTKEEAIPQFTLKSGNGTFEVGAIVEGVSSGAKARILRQNGTTVNFTYLGKIRFVVDEVIKSKETGLDRTIDSVDNNGAINIKKRYKFRDGQSSQSFNWSYLKKRSSASKVDGTLWIVLDWFKDEVPGKFYTVNSYYDADYKDIPYYMVAGERIYLSNLIDWRTNQSNILSNDGSYVSPYTIDASQIATSTTLEDFENRNYDFNLYLTPSGTTDGDIEYYLGRIDDLYLDKNGNFINKKGIPALIPEEPEESLANAMKVGQITMPAYVRNLDKVTFKRSTNRRYTMKDIGKLEDRIDNVEYYTQLSLLESDTANMFIRDSATGLNRLKNGFLVDNFTSHDIGDPEHPNYNCAIDSAYGELRPQHYTTNVSLIYKEEPTNYIKGDLLMLDYTDKLLVEQPYAAVSENVNPFAVVSWVGLMNIFPASDDWIDEKRLPETITQVEGDFTATLMQQGADPNTGFAPVQWDAWRTQWSSTSTSSSTSKERRSKWPKIRKVTTTTTRTTSRQSRTGIRTRVTPRQDRRVLGDRVVDTTFSRWKRSRNFSITGYRLKPNVRLYPFMEGRNMSAYTTPKIIAIEMRSGIFQNGEDIALAGRRRGRKFRAQLTPPQNFGAIKDKDYVIDPYTGNEINITSYNASSTFLNLNISSLQELAGSNRGGYLLENDVIIGLKSGATAKVTKKHFIADEKGNIRCSIFIPDPSGQGNPRWKTGDSVVRLTDSPTNSMIPGVVDSSAENTYSARGTILTKQQDTLLVRNADVTRDRVNDSRIISSSRTSTRRTGWYDPLAQSFLVEEKGGCFISKIDVYFRTKDSNLPVTMQIREMVNGYPSPTVLATENKDPFNVSLSDDATVSTTFTFETPVYLAERKEYCFVLLTSSVEYNVWLSEMGKDDLNGERISKQPYAGVLFKSQNASTWTTAEYQDMKFKIFRCKFKTNETPTIDFINDNSGNLFFRELREDPIELTINESGTARGYLKVNQKNHGLHDDSSFVEIKGISSGIETLLAADWSGSTADAITLTGENSVRNLFYANGSSGSQDMIFDSSSNPTRNGILGVAPSAANPGYISIGGYVYSYDPTNVGNVISGTFTLDIIEKITEDNVPSNGFKSADEWEVELYVKNGIPLTLINKVHQNLKFITLDSYQLDFNSYRRNVDDENVTFGGDEATASTNLQYTSFMPTIAFKELPGTSVVSTFKGTSGTSVGNGKYSLPTPDVQTWYRSSYRKDSGFKQVRINENNYVNKPKVIASSINEERQMSNANSFDFRIKLSSTVDNLSPVIDTDRISLITTNNRIDNFDGSVREGFFADNLSNTYDIGTSPENDFNSAIYITKLVTLQQECTSLKIILAAFNNSNTNFDIYVKLLAGDEENPNEIEWDEIVPGDDYAKSKSEVDFADYEYETSLTGNNTFTQYSVKIRMRSNNSCDIPIIKDLRCIALA